MTNVLKVSGIAYEDFLSRQKGSILEEYSTKIWNTISKVQTDGEQGNIVKEIRDIVVKKLECLQETINIAILFDDGKLKRIAWEKLDDDCRLEISRSFSDIITKELTAFQNVIQESNGSNSIEQEIAYVIKHLVEIPTPESLVFDEQTRVIKRESLNAIYKSVRSLIRTLRHITGSDIKVGILVRSFMKDGIPCNNACYREIYEILSLFGFIPKDTFQVHNHNLPDVPYLRENYIKSFVIRDKKKQ